MNFTPSQKYSLLSKMGYSGPESDDQMNAFLQSNPGAAAKMGKFDRALKRGFATGGSVEEVQQQQQDYQSQLDAAEKAYRQAQTNWANMQANPFSQWMNPAGYSAARSGVTTSQQALEALRKQSPLDKAQQNLSVAAAVDPSAIVQRQQVEEVQATPETLIQEGTGQVEGEVAAGTTTAQVDTTQAPEEITTSTMEAKEVTPEVEQALEGVTAATAEPTKAATVKGQLESLMEDFEGGQTPPWASGAMRQAMGIMQQRGLGASSMAGAAVVQAAMESALPIAAQDAQTQAQFEMQNLNNQQQTTIFKTQQKIAGLLSDQSAINAAEQFNAASENQTKQFMSNLETQVAQFNSSQINAIRQFNAGQENATEQFNANIRNLRDQFNAQNSLVIAQANAKWRQQIDTLNTATQNQANQVYTASVNGLTGAALDNYWQKQRDIMTFAFQSGENEKDRANNLLISQLTASAEMSMQSQKLKAQDKAGLGSLAATALFGGSGGGGLLGGVVSGIGEALGGIF